MLFMLISRPKPGATRQQLVDDMSSRMRPGTWDLIRNGVLSHVLYKVGDEPGFFAVLQAASLEQAKALVKPSPETALFDIDIVPVNQFPHFD